MDRSLIPPPTVLMTSPRADDLRKEVSKQDNDELWRVDRALQRHMQTLLDAQNSALFGGGDASGSEGGDNESRSSEQSQIQASVVKVEPVRQPSHAPLGVREVRHDIGNTMSKLSIVKKQQVERSGDNLELIHALNARLEEWEKRENRLKDTIDSMRHDRRDEEARQLLEEEDSLQEQINAMERKLTELRAQQQLMRRKRSNLQNATQANASSYEASLAMLVREKDEFLRTPSTDLKSILMSVDAPVLKTHVKCRTLAQVASALKDAEQFEIARRDEAKAENSALSGGKPIWKDTARRVDHIEAAVKSGLAKLSSSTASKDDMALETQQLLSTLTDGVQGLQELYNTVEDQGWSLLVCCIGAELEALKRGSDIIQKTLHTVQEKDLRKADDEDANSASSSSHNNHSGGIANNETDPQDLIFSRKDTDSD